MNRTASPNSVSNTLDFDVNTDRFGFSTGALEKGDYQSALAWMRQNKIHCVELSALRYAELEPLVNDIDQLPLDTFSYVSFHAPSAFSPEQEGHVVSLLERVAKKNWNIVVHPDVLYTPKIWARFGRLLLLENMDRRKTVGRTVEELSELFAQFPDARMCLDVAHARQLDTTLTLLRSLASTFQGRIAEVHMSELDSRCQHRPLSEGAVADYQQVASRLRDVPVIIESVLDASHSGLRRQELELTWVAMQEKINGNIVNGHDTVRVPARQKTAS